ncbi:MAG: DUF2279 domain-containing protein [Calditrichae bacterium]|nr:DUF2279 domain-containing protein [Calditrichia bacterium]
MTLKLLFVFIALSAVLNAAEYKTFSTDSLQSNLFPENEIEKSDFWFGRDKGLHFAGSFILTGIASQSLKHFSKTSANKSIVVGVSFTFSIGLTKEIFDGQKENNIFSYKDLTADALGILVGFFVFR